MSANPERLEAIEREIAVRAYRRWVRRGCPHGDSLADWFGARAEIEAELARRDHDRQVAMFDA